tara:strand:+ start:983 stop:1330 length:348 start_codon:yes stop_codon:yes gene_type:complete
MKESKKSGRPNDKSLYVETFLSNIDVVDDNNNEDIKKALNKLNAKDLLMLSAYVSKNKRADLKSFLKNVPEKTVAQIRRYKSIVNIYNDLKGKTNEQRENKKEEECQATSQDFTG